jgi:hypothetical protein
MLQISELLVNITKHVLHPKHEILTTEEKKVMLRKYKLEDKKITLHVSCDLYITMVVFIGVIPFC